MEFDLLIKNADIITMDKANPRGTWLAVKEGRIAAIGDSEPPSTALREIDLSGKALLPGFIDTHVHGSLTGNALTSINLNGITDKEIILQKIKNFGANIQLCNIVSAYGYSGLQTDTNLRITAKDLDDISSEQIIIIYDKSYHGCVLNTKGLEAAELYPGLMGVETKNGIMTGVVTDDVPYYLAIRNIMKGLGPEVIESYMRAVNDFAVRKGVTTIHSLDGGDFFFDMPIWITKRDIMDIHVVNYWETMDFELVEPYGLPRIGGCICLDGTRVLRTMALNEPYADMPSTRGFLYYKDQDVYNFVKEADNRGMQCSMHATGDRAIDQYIYVLDRVIRENGKKNLRHRIEHFSMPADRHIEMAVELELALPMQPIFTKIWDTEKNSLYKQRFGKKRAENVEPLAKIVRAGGKICGSSDSPVTEIDPLAGIDACVNNPAESRRISLDEALKIFTINGAWAAHEEKERGSIEVGKAADMVVLDRSPYAAPEEISNLQVEMTFVEGKLLYEKTCDKQQVERDAFGA